MSLIDTWASPSAFMAASAARSTVSRSGCLPNLVMWMPRIQMSSLAMSVTFHRFEAEADGFGALIVSPHHIRRQADFHSRVHMLGVGSHVDDVAADARPVAVDHPGHERHRDA